MAIYRRHSSTGLPEVRGRNHVDPHAIDIAFKVWMLRVPHDYSIAFECEPCNLEAYRFKAAPSGFFGEYDVSIHIPLAWQPGIVCVRTAQHNRSRATRSCYRPLT